MSKTAPKEQDERKALAELRAKVEAKLEENQGFNDFARLNHAQFRGVGSLIIDGRNDALKWVIEQIDSLDAEKNHTPERREP